MPNPQVPGIPPSASIPWRHIHAAGACGLNLAAVDGRWSLEAHFAPTLSSSELNHSGREALRYFEEQLTRFVRTREIREKSLAAAKPMSAAEHLREFRQKQLSPQLQNAHALRDCGYEDGCNHVDPVSLNTEYRMGYSLGRDHSDRGMLPLGKYAHIGADREMAGLPIGGTFTLDSPPW